MTVTSALDPSFGTRGVVLGASSLTDTNLSTATAVAVQTDGKIVAVGAVGQTAAISFPGLAARRYNADGSVDTTFGTNGQVVIPYSNSLSGFAQTPKNLVIEPSGDIVFAAVAGSPSIGMSGLDTTTTVVVRLTSDGQLDSTFGTNGEFAVPQAAGDLSAIGVSADGKIVVAGYSSTGGVISVVRVTAAGALDTSFHTTGMATVAFPSSGLTGLTPNLSFGALAVTPAGQVLVSGNAYTQFGLSPLYNSFVAELSADGTLNAGFGTAGYSTNLSQVNVVTGLAVQPDSTIVVAGNHEFVSPSIGVVPATALAHLTPSGVLDLGFVLAVASDSGGESATSLALGADGSIVVGGNKTIGVNSYPFRRPLSGRWRARL